LTARQGAGGSEDVLRSIPDGAAPYPSEQFAASQQTLWIKGLGIALVY
jgi:hypothetical protein